MRSLMILVFCEVKDNTIRKPSLEVLSEARKLADTANLSVGALFICTNCCTAEAAIKEAAQYGADTILTVKTTNLNTYSSDSYSKIVASIVRDKSVSILLSAATSTGKDLMPRVAARLNAGYAADVTAIDLIDGKLECLRPIYSSKVFATVTFQSPIQIATIRPNTLTASVNPKAGTVESIEIEVDTPMCIVKEVISREDGKIDITEATVIVAGGRGLEDVANLKLLEELADALPGGVIGASRAAVDAGWGIPHSSQVGQTGKAVSPNLYFACGISGAIQHVAGMSSSKTIVAINKDPDAPIFKVANYSIVGNLLEVLPALTKAIKAIDKN